MQMGISFKPRCLLLAGVALWLTTAAHADDASSVAQLEKQAIEQVVAGEYGAADEKIRAAIVLADNDTFMRLALLQGLIATYMGGDGRSVAWLISATTLGSMLTLPLWAAWLAG